MKKRIFVLMILMFCLYNLFYYYQDVKSNEISQINYEADIELDNIINKNYYDIDKKISVKVKKFNKRYQYSLEIIWLKIPDFRGNDILGVILKNTKIIKTSIHFELKYIVNKKEYEISPARINVNNNSVTTEFKLPTSNDTSYIKCRLTLDFETNDKDIDIYSDYAHKLKKIPGNNISKYFMSYKGIVLDNKSQKYYSDLPVVYTKLNLK